MEIKEYLKDITTLSLEKLTEKYGENPVYDNYRILLNGDLDEVKNIIDNSGKFEFQKTINFGGKTHIFHYIPGIVYLQLNSKQGHDLTYKGYEQMEKDFNSHISLHPYYARDMEDISYELARGNKKSEESKTALSRGINDISKMLIENKIPFCIPNSSKWIFNKKQRYYSEMAKFIP